MSINEYKPVPTEPSKKVWVGETFPDKTAVRKGDTATIVVTDDKYGSVTVTGTVWEGFPGDLAVGPHLLSRISTVLTDHQPAVRYDPDTVARATLYGKHENVQVVRMDTDSDLEWRTAFLYNGSRFHADEDVTDIQPLATIDPVEARRSLEFSGFGAEDVKSIMLVLRLEN